MATAAAKPIFEQTLKASGLLPAKVIADVRATSLEEGVELRDALVDRGLLNAWQVDQLCHGRSKFSLGPYQIVDAIGRGGMGHVFKGRHTLLDRVEAIKVLPRDRTNKEAVSSFQREIRAQAQLDHPNLVRVSFADRDGDTYYLVTEFVPGVDLRRLVRRAGALPIDVAALLVTDIASGLEYAHRRGLVHRDVKPGNVLVTPDGSIKVTDLGLAWRLDDRDDFDDRRDGPPRIVGTCDYLAPEVVRRPTCIMPVSDVYALGCTLYYALTGKVPYPGGNPRQKFQRVLREDPIAPRSLRPGLPRKLVALLAEMMHKDHDQRTPSAAAAAERLRSYVASDSRATLAELVRRHERSSSRDSDHADSGSDATVVAPFDDEQLNPSLPQPPDDPGQATRPLASADQETTPLAATADQPAPPSAAKRPRSPVDTGVLATVILATAATATLVASAIWRNL